MDNKVCNKCGKVKDQNEFHLQSLPRIGRHTICKECRNKQSKDRRQKLKEKNLNKDVFKETPFKVCHKCKETKETKENFYISEHLLDGLSDFCKTCERIKAKNFAKKYRLRNHNKEFSAPEKKICSVCKNELSLQNFHKNIMGKNGLQSFCKKCAKEKYRQYNDRLIHRFKIYRKRDKNCPLTIEQFDSLTKQVCHYCGQYTTNRTHTGIDRKNNNVGYTIENCVPCCHACNWMKRHLNIQDFINHCKLIASRF